MYSFLARQAILDKKMQTVAYELLFRDGEGNCFPNVSPEYATSKIISDQFLCIPITRISGKHSSFVNVPYQMIINGLVGALPNDTVVIEILENAAPDNELLRAVQCMYDNGYKFALDDFTMDSGWDRFMPYISVIKFDVKDKGHNVIFQYISEKKHLLKNVKLLAEKIESKAEFELYLQSGFSLFQGFFFSHPEILKAKCLSQNTLSLSKLIFEINRESYDFAEIERLLNSDLTLSYKIMRYVNHLIFKSYGIIRADNLTMKEMLIYLGIKEVRRILSVAALASIGGEVADELYYMSMVRAKFCELITVKINNTSLSYDAFICGLFSLLDVILECPMEDLMRQLSIPRNVRNFLCKNEGELCVIFNLMLNYERLNWEKVSELCMALKIPEYSVIEIMQSAAKWADENWFYS